MAAIEDNNAAASRTLAQATVEDVPALVQVHAAAFRSDPFAHHLMLLSRPDGAHQTLMQKSIEHWLADPQARVIKAAHLDGQGRCLVLQGRGLGTRLVRWGTDRADAEGGSAVLGARLAGGPRPVRAERVRRGGGGTSTTWPRGPRAGDAYVSVHAATGRGEGLSGLV